MSYFDNFLITLILCVGAGFATDNLNKFMKVPMGGPQPPASVSDVKGKEPAEEFICPDKPLPPEPPAASSESEEDEEPDKPETEKPEPEKPEFLETETPESEKSEPEKPVLNREIPKVEVEDVSQVKEESLPSSPEPLIIEKRIDEDFETKPESEPEKEFEPPMEMNAESIVESNFEPKIEPLLVEKEFDSTITSKEAEDYSNFQQEQETFEPKVSELDQIDPLITNESVLDQYPKEEMSTFKVEAQSESIIEPIKQFMTESQLLLEPESKVDSIPESTFDHILESQIDAMPESKPDEELMNPTSKSIDLVPESKFEHPVSESKFEPDAKEEFESKFEHPVSESKFESDEKEIFEPKFEQESAIKAEKSESMHKEESNSFDPKLTEQSIESPSEPRLLSEQFDPKEEQIEPLSQNINQPDLVQIIEPVKEESLLVDSTKFESLETEALNSKEFQFSSTAEFQNSPSPQLMESVQPPENILEQIVEESDAKFEQDSPVIPEKFDTEKAEKSKENETPPLSPEEPQNDAPTSLPVTQDLLGHSISALSSVDSEKLVNHIADTQTVDFLSGIEPKPASEIQDQLLDLGFETTPLHPSIVKEVGKSSLEEHEQELARLLTEAQRDSNSPVKPDELGDLTDEQAQKDAVEQELEGVVTREKDEGDPWVLDECGRGGGGESLVHLDSDDLANKDDISHCAVFGDDVEPDDLELDEDEKRPRGSTGSSSDSSSSEGPEPEMMKAKKADTISRSSSSSEEADEVGGSQPHTASTPSPPPPSQSVQQNITSVVTDLLSSNGKSTEKY